MQCIDSRSLDGWSATARCCRCCNSLRGEWLTGRSCGCGWSKPEPEYKQPNHGNPPEHETGCPGVSTQKTYHDGNSDSGCHRFTDDQSITKQRGNKSNLSRKPAA